MSRRRLLTRACSKVCLSCRFSKLNSVIATCRTCCIWNADDSSFNEFYCALRRELFSASRTCYQKIRRVQEFIRLQQFIWHALKWFHTQAILQGSHLLTVQYLNQIYGIQDKDLRFNGSSSHSSSFNLKPSFNLIGIQNDWNSRKLNLRTLNPLLATKV